MHSNIIISFTIVFLVISLSHANTILTDNGHFELTNENASVFLHTTTDNDSADVDKREMGKNCIPCKFGLNPCCEPNICRKKTFWFDECMEIKRAKPDHSD